MGSAAAAERGGGSAPGSDAPFPAGVAVVRLQQPPVNGLSLALLTELCLALQKLEDHRACRGLVIASVGRGRPGWGGRRPSGRPRETRAPFSAGRPRDLLGRAGRDGDVRAER